MPYSYFTLHHAIETQGLDKETNTLFSSYNPKFKNAFIDELKELHIAIGARKITLIDAGDMFSHDVYLSTVETEFFNNSNDSIANKMVSLFILFAAYSFLGKQNPGDSPSIRAIHESLNGIKTEIQKKLVDFFVELRGFNDFQIKQRLLNFELVKINEDIERYTVQVHSGPPGMEIDETHTRTIITFLPTPCHAFSYWVTEPEILDEYFIPLANTLRDNNYGLTWEFFIECMKSLYDKDSRLSPNNETLIKLRELADKTPILDKKRGFFGTSFSIRNQEFLHNPYRYYYQNVTDFYSYIKNLPIPIKMALFESAIQNNQNSVIMFLDRTEIGRAYLRSWLFEYHVCNSQVTTESLNSSIDTLLPKANSESSPKKKEITNSILAITDLTLRACILLTAISDKNNHLYHFYYTKRGVLEPTISNPNSQLYILNQEFIRLKSVLAIIFVLTTELKIPPSIQHSLVLKEIDRSWKSKKDVFDFICKNEDRDKLIIRALGSNNRKDLLHQFFALSRSIVIPTRETSGFLKLLKDKIEGYKDKDASIEMHSTSYTKSQKKL